MLRPTNWNLSEDGVCSTLLQRLNVRCLRRSLLLSAIQRQKLLGWDKPSVYEQQPAESRFLCMQPISHHSASFLQGVQQGMRDHRDGRRQGFSFVPTPQGCFYADKRQSVLASISTKTTCRSIPQKRPFGFFFAVRYISKRHSISMIWQQKTKCFSL